jgi:hypothetical protein
MRLHGSRVVRKTQRIEEMKGEEALHIVWLKDEVKELQEELEALKKYLRVIIYTIPSQPARKEIIKQEDIYD